MAENEERKAHSQWVSELPSGSEVAPPHHNQRDRWPPGSGLIPVTWWWWWEIGASAISIVSMVLLLALLFSIDRTRVDSWGLKIRPNSLISLSTTAARTAMMVSVTSCISQLKWRHYLRGPDRLHYLQIFDDASRGPWGALVALLTLRTKTPAIMALAAVTLVSLAVEPMAQQILDISEDRIPLGNDTAKVAVADSYISASLLPDGTVTHNALLVRSALLRAITGDTYQPNFYCPAPAKFCSWESFTTLAVCRDTHNFTGIIQPNCTSVRIPIPNIVTPEIRCTYSFPTLEAPHPLSSGDGFPRDLEATFGGNQSENRIQEDDVRFFKKTIFNSTAKIEQETIKSGYNGGASFNFIRVKDNGNVLDMDLPEAEIVATRWYYCAQTFYNVTATPTEISIGHTTSEPLYYDSLDASSSPVYYRYKAPSTATIYSITQGQRGSIWHALAGLLDYKPMWLVQLYNDTMPPQRAGTDDIDYSQFLYEADYEKMLENVTQAATNLIRSGSPGDNLNASFREGEAYSQEPFYIVRWQWMIVPLLEVVVIVALLALSIRQTKNEQLFKTSVAAYLVHGLEGWSDSELDALLPEKESIGTLEEMSKGMVASLQADGNGRLKFKNAS